jgi:hypothetical protein
MAHLDRRTFLTTAALSVAATQLRAQSGPARASLELPAEVTGPQMPLDFVGLSYELQQLADPSFFSAANTGLIQQCKALASRGVLRLGGNTSEFSWWKATPQSPEPQHPQTRIVEGEPRAQYYAVTPEAVRNLAQFLKAAGWTCLYGIGMGTNTPERAADEGAFVARTLGPSLQYFQIGNEVDLFDRHLRDPKTWSPKAYLDEWLVLARAIAARVPDAKFGMPDVAAHVEWLPQLAELWPSVQNPPHLTTLTHHYYFGGPATNADINIPNLLKQATMGKVQQTADIATAAAKKMGVRVRMTEGNTCYRGGKPGLSDVFAAALWAADYSLLLASNNYSGINLHGGTGKSVANSVGGFLPGDVMLKDQGRTPAEIATYPHPFYTPIATFGSEYVLEPVAYGMKFAALLAGGTFYAGNLSEKLQATGIDATAYAARLASGQVRVIVLNKDAARDLELSLHLAGAKTTPAVAALTLHAPALDSRETAITPSPQGTPLRGRYTVTVSHASGLCLTFA